MDADCWPFGIVVFPFRSFRIVGDSMKRNVIAAILCALLASYAVAEVRRLGANDLEWATPNQGAATTTTSTLGKVVTKIDAATVPFRNAAGYVDDLVNGWIGIKVSSVTGNGGNISGFDNGTFTGTVTSNDVKTRGPWLDVRAFGAVGDGVTDDTTAVQAAIDNCPNGGTVLFPGGTYRVTGAGLGFTSKYYKSIHLKGVGQYRSLIQGDNCAVILDLAGSNHCSIEDLTINAVNSCGVGLLLGRYSGFLNGGGHNFTRTTFAGTFRTAAVYNIASEENLFVSCRFHSSDNVALLYVSAANDLSVTTTRGTLQASTQTGPNIIGCTFASYGLGAGSIGLHVVGSAQHLSMTGSYIAAGGDGVRISGANAIGPFVFESNFIEMAPGGAATFKGLHLEDTRIYSLFFRNSLFSTASTATTYADIYQDNCTASNGLENSELAGNRYSNAAQIDLHSVRYSRIDEPRETVGIRATLAYSVLFAGDVTWGASASSYGSVWRKRETGTVRDVYGSLPSPTASAAAHSTLAIARSTAAPPTLEDGILDVADGTTWHPWGPASSTPIPMFYDNSSWRPLLPIISAAAVDNTAVCKRGTIAIDNNYIYVCGPTDNNWKRATLAAY